MIAVMLIERDFKHLNSGKYIHGAFSLRSLISDQEHIVRAVCTRRVRNTTNVSWWLCVSSSAIRRVVRIMAISHLLRVSHRLTARLLGMAAFVAASMFAAEAAQAFGRGGHGGHSGYSGAVGGGRSFSAHAVRTFSAGPASVGAGSHRFVGGPHFVGRPAFVHRRHGGFVGGVYYDDVPYDYPVDDGYVAAPVDDYPVAIVEDEDIPRPGPGFVTVAARGCRLVVSAYGPRLFCNHRYHRVARWHRAPARHHDRRLHHAKR